MSARHAHGGAACVIGDAPAVRWDDAPEMYPAPIVPEQFFADRQIRLPEHRLMRAVLEKALADFDATVDAKGLGDRRIFMDVDQWFASDDITWPCSFACICDVLDLEPAAIRARLRRRSVAVPRRRARRRISTGRNLHPIHATTTLSGGSI